MEANVVTLIRIALVFVTVGLFQISSFYLQAFAIFMVIFVIYLDSLDGYIARKFKVASEFGALFDIVGDRIVESIFWIYFAYTGMISFWVPMIVITRGFLSDNVRALAFRSGKTPFGKKTMMKSKFTRFLVSSRFSRGFYGITKAILFTYLGILIFLNTGIEKFKWSINSDIIGTLYLFSDILVYITLFMCIVRGLPVLWDGKEILFDKIYPRTIKIIDEKSSNI